MCLTPITLKRDYKELSTPDGSSGLTNIVPCGKCVKCLARRRNHWSFRLFHQMKTSTSAAFITLTYNEENLPISPNGIPTLNKRDLQLFFKRLRKYEQAKGNREPIKYYAVGEYGSRYSRPHYHVIIFGVSRSTLLRSQTVMEGIWKAGVVDIAPCNIGTISYTTGYIMQGTWRPSSPIDDRVPHFSNMSKGLGQSYLTPNTISYHKQRLETGLHHPNGFFISMPRYYADKIFTKAEKKLIRKKLIEANSIDWFEFINTDFREEVERKKAKIYNHDKKEALARAAF